MKGLSKEKLMIMIDTLYKDNSSVVLLSDITKNFEIYGDEYYMDHGLSEWELTVKNPNWRSE